MDTGASGVHDEVSKSAVLVGPNRWWPASPWREHPRRVEAAPAVTGDESPPGEGRNPDETSSATDFFKTVSSLPERLAARSLLYE
jgi:hypothetical protein